MNVVEVIAAAIIGMALLWLVIQPLVSPIVAAPTLIEPPDPEETPRGQALLALKEIEFDRATGKLSDADYHALNTKYTAAALATLDAPASPSASLRCLIHGARPESDAVFCSECGGVLVTANDTCAACAAPLPADAVFCPGCGSRVRGG